MGPLGSDVQDDKGTVVLGSAVQKGRLQRVRRRNAPAVWIFRWYEVQAHGRKAYRKTVIGTVEEYKTERDARCPVGWHTFRRTVATLLFANGEDIKTVQESLRTPIAN